MTDALIPLGLSQFSERYRGAEQLYKIYKPKQLVAHSLGSHLAMRLNEKYKVPYKAYSTPTVPWMRVPEGSHRYSHIGDPISMGDINSKHNFYTKGFNVHDYGGY